MQTNFTLAQTKEDYSLYLMNQKDYFRAISNYKELYFFSKNDTIKLFCLKQISRAYYFSNYFAQSISYASKSLEFTFITNAEKSSLSDLIGLNYFKMKAYSISDYHFKKSIENNPDGNGLLFSTLTDVANGNFSEATNKYTLLSKKKADSLISNKFLMLSSISKDASNISEKSPMLAGIFSAVIPGIGQIYSKHYYDGLQAFVYCIATSFAAYASYRYDKNFNNNYITTYVTVPVAAIFYIANILGAVRTAEYYNYKQQIDYQDQIYSILFQIEF